MTELYKNNLVSLRIRRFSHRFAEQVLNSNLTLKNELESILTEPLNPCELSRPKFNKFPEERFVAKGWKSQPHFFNEVEELGAKMDFFEGESWRRSGLQTCIVYRNRPTESLG